MVVKVRILVMLTDKQNAEKRTNKQTEHQIRKEPCYGGDLSPYQV